MMHADGGWPAGNSAERPTPSPVRTSQIPNTRARCRSNPAGHRLRNAPALSEWLAGAVGYLSDQQLVPPASDGEQLCVLLQLIGSRRCLLVFDNFERLFEAGQEGRCRAGMECYRLLLQAFGEASHQSSLLMASRDAPPELAIQSGVGDLELHDVWDSKASSIATGQSSTDAT
jgi:hypothetical protein